ncbi:MAG TPA: hypothetical protein VL495_01020 [Edaphobacter sp.]|jgi:hypothetical protein|nr:hypothetical protein [Edaphobacter sp.]
MIQFAFALIMFAAPVPRVPVVTVCDLVRHPFTYDGKELNIKSAGFFKEGYLLEDNKCPDLRVALSFEEHRETEKQFKDMPVFGRQIPALSGDIIGRFTYHPNAEKKYVFEVLRVGPLAAVWN